MLIQVYILFGITDHPQLITVMPKSDFGSTAHWGIIFQELLHPVSLVSILVAVADQGSWCKKKIRSKNYDSERDLWFDDIIGSHRKKNS